MIKTISVVLNTSPFVTVHETVDVEQLPNNYKVAININSNYNVITLGGNMAHIIHIGNSFGVRIPKAIIQQVGFKENMDLVFKVTEEGLLISQEKQVREGWEQKFKPSKEELRNLPLAGEFSNEFDKDEWEW